MFNKSKNIGMDEKEFWRIIDMFNWNHAGDDEKVIKKALKYLSKKADEDIFRFEDILSKLLYDLDGKEYAKHIGEGAYVNENTYFSPDEFLYSRCVVVANGREFYDEVLNDPKSMPEDMEFEALLYIASEAFEMKNDEEYECVPKFDYETYSNESKWKE
ncbi:DUF4240 domain-containing protein [Neobacillus notoginsengisoli]|uniref:DUF4240 domain-containing protein n=1 Tax=Neobacillus notoginsengisoli TaxID=1578198 RepID=A0A417YZU5_9BACI|nr:DUF4240 domain-containing protein [Neobacillus notoginsengisoli]RHW43392.1 DUF4240 domain-containing protein [Neobacillus notoginsengisoli]